MRKLSIALTVIGTVVIGGLVLLGVQSGVFAVRSFTLDHIAVDATVLPDGSMLVTEQVTYTFHNADSQPFTVGSRSFEPTGRPGTITAIAASENGEPRRTLLATPTLFEWDIAPAHSGTRTFQLQYRVTGAVQAWADTAELYWNWIGTTSPAVEQWSATVRFPSGPGEIRAWAHGPLDGALRISGDAVTSAVDQVPEGQFVDNRIIVPTERFDLQPSSQPRLDAILREEARNAEIANRQRAAADRSERLRRGAARALTVLMVPLIIAASAAFYWVWRTWGKDPPKPTDIGDYWREVPDDPPAVAVALLNWRRVDSDAFSATVLDLARRGYLQIDEIDVPRLLRKPRSSYQFTSTATPDAPPLKAFERRTMNWMFSKSAAVVTQDELIEQAKANPSRANTFWEGFKKDVVKELDRRDYLARGKGVAFALHALIVGLLGAAGVAALALGAVPAGIGGLVAAVVLLPLGILHRSRTPAGTRRDAEWRALRSFLRDFSSLDEAPVGHLALWDQYLVAATALGVADELLDALKTKFPEVLESGSVATWYHPRSSSPSGIAGLGGFGQSFGSPAVSSFSPPSSSSGGGGGFSSGGGGGGGGGGFGAR
jgi:uncharacterized membrane protein